MAPEIQQPQLDETQQMRKLTLFYAVAAERGGSAEPYLVNQEIRGRQSSGSSKPRNWGSYALQPLKTRWAQCLYRDSPQSHCDDGMMDKVLSSHSFPCQLLFCSEEILESDNSLEDTVCLGGEQYGRGGSMAVGGYSQLCGAGSRGECWCHG